MGILSYSGRLTVEECNSITTKLLNKHNCFDGRIHSGGMSWTRGGEKIGDISFEVSTYGGDDYIQFQYTHTDRYTGEKTELDYKAQLTWTPCNFRGRRWWFICPLVVNGRECNRRVGVLYLGNGKHFGCRNCHNLTYRCQKEHDSRVDALVKNPEMLISHFRKGDIKSFFLAHKAYLKIIEKLNKSRAAS